MIVVHYNTPRGQILSSLDDPGCLPRVGEKLVLYEKSFSKEPIFRSLVTAITWHIVSEKTYCEVRGVHYGTTPVVEVYLVDDPSGVAG